jgi:hypothetical protein
VTERRPRGRLDLYLVSVASLVGAIVAVAVAARGFLESTGLLWLSVGLSSLALVSAVAAVLAPCRRAG